MKAGILKDKIYLYKPVVTKTDYGDTKVDFEQFYETRASVLWNSGNRDDVNNEIFFAQYKTFIMRSYVPITEHCQILFNNKKYRVLNIEYNEKYRNLEVNTSLVNE